MNSGKFFTTLEQHEANKRHHHKKEFLWHMVSAADPRFLQEYMNTLGPYVYHGTTADAARKIADEGLYPHDAPEMASGAKVRECRHCGSINPVNKGFEALTGNCRHCGEHLGGSPMRSADSASNYDGFFRTRTGHTYIGSKEYLENQHHIKGGLLAIDLRKLDPEKMNPDEDHYYPDSFTFNGQHPAVDSVFTRSRPPSSPYNMNSGHPDDSLGAWAERANLGKHPIETQYSMEKGSMAYNGHVPPEAIQLVGTGRYFPQQHPPNPWLTPGWDKSWMADDATPVQSHNQYHNSGTQWQIFSDASDISDRVTQSDSELHVALNIPRHSAKGIYRWVRDQEWPEGTELEPPSDYHITLMYTPSGHNEHKDAWWIKHLEDARAEVVGFKVFPSATDGKGYAYVLEVESPEIKEAAEGLQAKAESHGLEITHFPGGYTPHITIAYSPDPNVHIDPPRWDIDVGPSEVSPPRLSTGKPRKPPRLRKRTGIKHCGSCDMFWKGQCWGFNRTPVDTDDVCDDWYQDQDHTPSGESKTAAVSADASQETQTLDNLSLRSVAHNLHYHFEQGGDSSDMVNYAHRLLSMIGYPTDDITTQAAIQSWQQLYPQDKLLTAKTADVKWQWSPKEGQGRGLVDSEGNIHIWPENDMTHHQKSYLLGEEPFQYNRHFQINPRREFKMHNGADDYSLVPYIAEQTGLLPPPMPQTTAGIRDFLRGGTGELPEPTHKCPNCGQKFLDNGWSGWSALTPTGYERGGWQCPGCLNDMGEVENRPTEIKSWDDGPTDPAPTDRPETMSDDEKNHHDVQFSNDFREG